MPSSAGLPTLAEATRIVPKPGSTVWRRSADARAFLAAGYALILQVAHPTVGAGVSEHSNFRADPWGRLLRTLDYVNVTVYGGPRAALEVGRRVREMHRHIQGHKPDGSRYYALEPRAYAWVHATLAAALIAANERFVSPWEPGELERFWRQWRPLGRLVGVRDGELPDDWADFGAYFETMIGELEDNETVRDVLTSLTHAERPPLPGLPERAWRAASAPAGRLVGLATVGLMPPALRARLGLPWSAANELELRAVARASRAAGPLMPGRLRVLGPSYLRWRREAIERGDVAAPAGRAA